MVFLKYLRYHHHFRAIFKPYKPYFNPTNLTSLASPHSTSLYSPLFSRTFSLSAQFAHKTCTKSTESDNAKETGNKAKKSLGVLFKDAAGLSKMPQQRDSDSESGNEATELRNKLRELEKEIRVLKGNKSKETENNNEKRGDNLLKKNNKPEDGVSISKNNKCSKPTPVSLSALFSKKPADSDGNAIELMRKGQIPVSLSKKPADSGGNANKLMRKGKEPVSLSKKPADSCANANQLMRKGEKLISLSKKQADQSEIGSKRIRNAEPIVYKELPGNMVEFARVLYQQGYLKDANFLPHDKFDSTAFENNYARNFLKHAARRFGKDHQEIAKWLSGSELKKVALFGCPSFSRKTLFSAKLLRTFFKIPEDTVCSKCALNQSCSYVNQRVWSKNNNNLDLPGVIDILTLYALESVPSKLVVPEEIKASVTLLLEEVVKLSKTGS